MLAQPTAADGGGEGSDGIRGDGGQNRPVPGCGDVILLVEVGCDEIELRADPPDLREEGGGRGGLCDGEGQEDDPEMTCKRGAAHHLSQSIRAMPTCCEMRHNLSQKQPGWQEGG